MSVPATIHDLLARTVGAHPDLSAVSDQETRLSYAELADRVDAVAHELVRLGVRAEDRIGVYVPRGVGAVVTVLGVLRAGAAYVPIDVGYPKRRRERMVQAGRLRLLLADPDTARRAAGSPVEVAELDWRVLAPAPAPAVHVDPRSAACVLFTSGSTGRPKGVVLEHRHMVAFAEDAVLPAVGPGDRMAQASNLSFDTFTFELLRSMAGGAELVVMPAFADLLGADLRRQLRRYRITVMLAPAIALNHVARHDREAFASLRVLCSGGDVLLADTCRELREGGFDGDLLNLYGPTEATVACTAQRVRNPPEDCTRVPIGHPTASARLYVLDDRLAPASSGELYVGGAAVGRGYLDQPGHTAQRFIADPFAADGSRMYATGDRVRTGPDGALEYLGRVDDQVKISGHRVEPAEVERALYEHPQVREAAVAAAGEDGGLRLVAFVIPAADEFSPARLRAFLTERLPAAYVPAEIVALDAMPLDANGKRDWARLREVAEDRSRRRRAYEPPRTATERYLVRLWEELLRVESIGVRDDFFGLGGHSLLAARGRMCIRRDLQTDLPPEVVFENSVVEDLAKAIDQVRSDPAGTADAARRGGARGRSLHTP
ncbi:non-ribosomal peptide synthetase [Planomonospora sp. ID82291]|uniref:non-ribosomal peptide synthetase n=1 Tax=Planomonospora sp. ID82291 TaxID=2738136 RepID=UPI0018C41F26|nr:non-ribosomal peptide synthetase [Planomonospora sp. ID82291]